MTASNPPNNHENYYRAMDILHTNLKLLYDRLNFFLVGTAFLIAAIVTGVIESHFFNTEIQDKAWPLILLLHLISAVGFIVALLFTSTNYLNAKMIGRMQSKLMEADAPKNLETTDPYAWVEGIIKTEWRVTPSEFLKKDLKGFICSPVTYSKDNPSAHTWFMPLIFVIFWVLLWFTVPTWGLNKVYFAVPGGCVGILLIYLSCIYLKNRRRRKPVLFFALLSPKGEGKDAIEHLKKLKVIEGIEKLEVYSTSGRFKGLIFFEAKDEKNAMKFVKETGLDTYYTVETITAIAAKEI